MIDLINNNPKRKKRIKYADFIMQCIALIIILRATFGIVMYIPGYTASVYFFLFIIWFILACFTNETYLGKVLKESYFLLVFLCINIVFDLFFSGYVTTIIKNYIIIFILYSLFLYYQKGYDSFKRITLFLLFADGMIIMINTLKEMLINPYISRQLATADGVANFDGNSNMLVSFQFIYAGICLIVYMITSTNQHDKTTRRFLYGFIIVFVYVLFKASYFFSILITIICLITYWLPKKKYLKYYFIISVFLLLPFFRVGLSAVLNNIASLNIINEVLYGKIRDLSNLLSGGIEGASQSQLRLELYLKSLQTFSQNLFFGVHSTWENSYSLGKHSGWIDGFAEFGIIRFVPFILFLRSSYKYLSQNLEATFKKSISISYTAFTIIGIINPHIFPQMWLVLYIVIPFLYTLNKNKIYL